jgi:serine/threonine-protein kinase
MSHNRRFQTINGVLESAFELPVSQREAYVLQCCGEDAALAAEALDLLALSKSAEGLLSIEGGELQAGDILGGRFRIVGELGCGGAGTVFLAEDSYLGKVALKVIHANLLASAMDRAAAEVKAGRGISHPNLCPLFDLFRFEDAPCGPIVVFTMKYLPGEVLQCRLARGPLDVSQAFEVARGVAMGLDALHHEGIIHCDLKPGNIMLTRRNEVSIPVILDFGLASLANSGRAVRLYGSPRYMAPEQFRPLPITAAADVYAFGLLLFEMISGKLPFPDEDIVSAAMRRNTEEPARLSKVTGCAPPGWDGAIAQAQSREPSSRPRSAMDVVALLPRPAGAESSEGLRPVRARPCCSHQSRSQSLRCGMSPRRNQSKGTF